MAKSANSIHILYHMSSTSTIIPEFILIVSVFVFVVYTKELLTFSTTILGKLTSVCILLYYTSLHKLYGLLAAAVIIYLQHHEYIRNQFYGNYVREGFGKDDFMQAHCTDGKLKYKTSVVNKEMAEHVFPEIKYNHPEHRCHPCDPACEYTIMEEKLTKENELLMPPQPNNVSPEKTILDFWKQPVASIGVFSEPFSYL